MKSKLKEKRCALLRRVTILLALLLLITYSIIPVSAEVLKIAAIDWPPQLDVNNKQQGYIMDIVTEVFKDSEYELEVVVYPWSRAIDLVKRGAVHAILSPAKAEAPLLLFPENEVGLQRMCFFVRADNPWTYSGLPSLKGLRIGIARDTGVGEIAPYAKTHRQQFQYMPYNKSYIYKSMRKLGADRMDTFLFTHNSTVFTLKALGFEGAYREAGCVVRDKVYMAFTADMTKEVQVRKMMYYFDKKMEHLKKAHAIAPIMKKYGLKKWQVLPLK